eukprot:EG_transcript_32204
MFSPGEEIVQLRGLPDDTNDSNIKTQIQAVYGPVDWVITLARNGGRIGFLTFKDAETARQLIAAGRLEVAGTTVTASRAVPADLQGVPDEAEGDQKSVWLAKLEKLADDLMELSPEELRMRAIREFGHHFSPDVSIPEMVQWFCMRETERLEWVPPSTAAPTIPRSPPPLPSHLLS